jgi:hypothetical protein
MTDADGADWAPERPKFTKWGNAWECDKGTLSVCGGLHSTKELAAECMGLDDITKPFGGNEYGLKQDGSNEIRPPAVDPMERRAKALDLARKHVSGVNGSSKYDNLAPSARLAEEMKIARFLMEGNSYDD